MNRNITALILIVIAVAIYFTYTQGQIDTDKSIIAVNDQYTTAIANSMTLRSIRDSVQKDYNNISLDERNRLDSMIPSSIDNIHLIVDVTKLANRSGFALKNIRADVISDTASGAPSTLVTASSSQLNLLPTMSLAKVKLTFDATAQYDKFISFMQDLEKSLRVMDITKLSMKANDSGVYDFSVEVNTYWLKQ